jgi:hypothetical protein
MKALLLALLLAALPAAAAVPPPAAPPPEAAPGLAYLRVRDVAAEAGPLAAALAPGRALVLDLRGARAGEADAAAFAAGLAGRTGRQPLFVLVGPDTPAGLVPERLPAGVATLGVAGARPKPQVVVAQDPAADRLAFAALDEGRPLEELVGGRLDKERFDEASLVREFENGNPGAEPPPAPDPATSAPATPRPPTDRVLQRAVNLHHALLAVRPRP